MIKNSLAITTSRTLKKIARSMEKLCRVLETALSSVRTVIENISIYSEILDGSRSKYYEPVTYEQMDAVTKKWSDEFAKQAFAESKILNLVRGGKK